MLSSQNSKKPVISDKFGKFLQNAKDNQNALKINPLA
jgi:hypothetical protein